MHEICMSIVLFSSVPIVWEMLSNSIVKGLSLATVSLATVQIVKL